MASSNAPPGLRSASTTSRVAFDAGFAEVKEEMRAGFAEVKEDLRAGFGRVDQDVRELRTDVNGLRLLIMTFGGGLIFALIGVIAAVLAGGA